jgi:hypothetical protein
MSCFHELFAQPRVHSPAGCTQAAGTLFTLQHRSGNKPSVHCFQAKLFAPTVCALPVHEAAHENAQRQSTTFVTVEKAVRLNTKI